MELRQVWEERKTQARALEEAAAICGAEGRSILPESSDTLEKAMLQYEGLLIAAALAHTGGKIGKAAEILGLTYQGLAYIINHRHQELLVLRSPVRRRVKRKSLG